VALNTSPFDHVGVERQRVAMPIGELLLCEVADCRQEFVRRGSAVVLRVYIPAVKDVAPEQTEGKATVRSQVRGRTRRATLQAYWRCRSTAATCARSGAISRERGMNAGHRTRGELTSSSSVP
jgi:hypothetical protein